jgi:ABC-2 type transport system permease protein
MFACTSLWSITLRYLRLWYNEPNVLLFNLYWPVLDVLSWGYLGMWIQRSQLGSGFQNYEFVALVSVLLWQFVVRSTTSIIVSFIEELWSSNIINLFSLPLRITEWVGGVILLSAITMMVTITAAFGMIAVLYDVSLVQLLAQVVIFSVPLFLTGVWLGFTALQVIVILGKRAQEIGWIIGWCFMPFSGAFYPTDVLPQWAQTVSNCIPMSYIFKGMRAYVMHHDDPMPYLAKGYALAILYSTTAVLLFIYCFKKSKQKGLARLVD